MKLLIDTHVFVWGMIEPSFWSAKAASALTDSQAEILISSISAYEIELKRPRDFDLQQLPPDLDAAVTGLGLNWLPVTHEHAALAGRLPRLHGDPFDRVIIAQALVEGASVVSADRWFSAYGAPVIW